MTLIFVLFFAMLNISLFILANTSYCYDCYRHLRLIIVPAGSGTRFWILLYTTL